MNPTFGKRHRELMQATVFVLFVALAFMVLAFGSALAGLPNAVISFKQAAIATGYAFAGLLALFVVSTLVALLIRFLSPPTRPNA